MYPGRLHAKGKLVEEHDVSFSIGACGEYLLYDSLLILTVGEEVTVRPDAVPPGALKFSVAPILPAGLLLEATTGVIYGKPSAPERSTMYNITVSGSAFARSRVLAREH